MQPIRLTGADDMQAVYNLLADSFAYMEGRIDPPSSLKRMTPATLAEQAARHELWILPGPDACMILTPNAAHLFLGRLAIAMARRGKGLARIMIAHAETRAGALGLPQIRLQTRIELTGNQSIFRSLGFQETGRTAHPGFDRATSVTFAKTVPT